MLDTSVAIGLRDNDPRILARVEALEGPLLMSVITRVELEGGTWRIPEAGPAKEIRLEALLQNHEVLAFDRDQALAYRQIVRSAGYSRRKVADRMIAAQALVAGATLVTLNPDDFTDVSGLQLLGW